MRILFVMLVPLLAVGRELPVGEPAEFGMSAEGLAKIGPVVEGMIREKSLVGASVLILKKGTIVYQEGFGQRDRENDLPMERDTLFRIFSMTKGLTSAAALILCDEGKLNLDDEVAAHLPEFKGDEVWVSRIKREKAERAPTVRDLLRHTSGLANRWAVHPVSRMYREGAALDTLLANIAEAPLLYQPGKRWVYGASSDVLAAVVAKVAGIPFEKFLEKRLIKPLGMVDTAYQVPRDKMGRLSVNYRVRKGRLMVADPAEGSKMLQAPAFKGGGSGLVSTITDYARFLQMIANGGEFQGKRYLRKETVELMRTNQLPKGVAAISFGDDVRPGTGFGLGFSVRVTNDGRGDSDAALGEYGWGGAASTHYWISPEHELVVITMEQTMPYNRNLEAALKPLIYGAFKK